MRRRAVRTDSIPSFLASYTVQTVSWKPPHRGHRWFILSVGGHHALPATTPNRPGSDAASPLGASSCGTKPAGARAQGAGAQAVSLAAMPDARAGDAGAGLAPAADARVAVR